MLKGMKARFTALIADLPTVSLSVGKRIGQD
jgi:hypothetical protein